jgi:hypothetical protein
MSKEIPILFSTEMVQALLDERKTMTRRVIKAEFEQNINGNWNYHFKGSAASNQTKESMNDNFFGIIDHCPYGEVGDILWVREGFKYDVVQDKNGVFRDVYSYKANFPEEHPKILRWKPSIHMPKVAARIWLEVVNVRVERLQDISEVEAIKEGIVQKYWKDSRGYFFIADDRSLTELGEDGEYVTAFEKLWHEINGKESWEANPWVWVVEFKVLSTTGRPEVVKIDSVGGSIPPADGDRNWQESFTI